LKNFVQKFDELDIDFNVIIGNHDTAFKNTNEYNSMNELYGHSKFKMKFYSEAENVVFDGLKITMLPWVCSGNYEHSMRFIQETDAQVLFGHLEIQGFEMYRGAVNDHGFSTHIFDKFDVVCSGHFHHKSSRGNINYLGSPFEITWSDWNDPRGFHIFDTDTRDIQFIQNPYKMFHKLHYDDSMTDLDNLLDIDTDFLHGTYVKIIIHNKTNPYWFDLYVDKVEKAGVLDLQIVDDNMNLNLEEDEEAIEEAEDTLSILRRSAEQIDSTSVDGKKLDMFLTELYTEALNVE
jgi:DNA repair exonuclease SbcCD nuclease subunit